MPSSASRPAANTETPSNTRDALTIFNGLILQQSKRRMMSRMRLRTADRLRPEDNTMHTARVVARVRRKPGTDTKFPAQFAGNWLSVPGFAPRETHPAAVLVHSTSPATMEQGPILCSEPEGACCK